MIPNVEIFESGIRAVKSGQVGFHFQRMRRDDSVLCK